MTYSPEDSSISSSAYDNAYYLESMEGADEFSLSDGRKLSRRLARAFNLANIKPGQRVLDIGCGRGEVTYHSARLNASAHGLDYAQAAIEIANELRRQAVESGLHMYLERAASSCLPYSNDSFDVVFMLDVVEHLYPKDLVATFLEVKRVLRSGGQLIVHTMPNSDYYLWGYPLFRALMKWRGKELPENPRLRWYRGETHVNIQNPRNLRKTLFTAGFSAVKVWLEPLNRSALVRILLSIPPWRWFLINDILGKATKL